MRFVLCEGSVVHDDGGSDGAYTLLCEAADECSPERFCEVLLSVLKDKTWMQRGTEPLPITSLRLELEIRVTE